MFREYLASRRRPSVILRPLNVKPNIWFLTKPIGSFCRISRRDEGRGMTFKREDIETLRLLRAFTKIADPERRREIVALVESMAKSDNEQPKPSR
jgi:hypothetical protein